MTTRQTVRDNAELMLAIFSAIEQRDTQRFAELVQPDFEIQWPPSLPYGGTYPDLDAGARQGRPDWAETWRPLQPTAAERRVDPRIVAANDQGEVVVLWRQRGCSPAGQRFDGPCSAPTGSGRAGSPERRCSTSIPLPWPPSWRT